MNKDKKFDDYFDIYGPIDKKLIDTAIQMINEFKVKKKGVSNEEKERQKRTYKSTKTNNQTQ